MDTALSCSPVQPAEFDAANNIITTSPLTMPEGKYLGKTLQEISTFDDDYIVFLSGLQLNYIQKIKYKDFFERIPAITKAAQEMVKSIPQPVVPKIPQAVKYPGGWRGW